MNARNCNRVFVGLALFLVLSCDAPPTRQPNIVLLISDDHDYEHFGFMGNEAAYTPHLDALAESGALFTTAHLPSSVCRPTLASLLSGRWPHQTLTHGAGRMKGGVGVHASLAPEDSLPMLLRDAGYRTYVAGKFWEGSTRVMGFTDGAAETSFLSFNQLVRNGQEDLFRFIDDHAGERPMFIWWAPMLPHAPHRPPARFAKLVKREAIQIPAYIRRGDVESFRRKEQTMLSMVAWLDEGVGKLFEKLSSVGAFDNTLFVFISDNGWSNGRPSKSSAFEKGIRTPMLFSWPKRIAAGQRFEELVSTMDIYPTILAFADVLIPSQAVGRNLQPVLEGSAPPREIVSIGALFRNPELDDGMSPERELRALRLREGPWKFVYYVADLSEESMSQLVHVLAPFPERVRGDTDLYNLDRDPYERKNVASDPMHRERIERYQAAVLEWWKETGGTRIPSRESGPTT